MNIKTFPLISITPGLEKCSKILQETLRRNVFVTNQEAIKSTLKQEAFQ